MLRIIPYCPRFAPSLDFQRPLPSPQFKPLVLCRGGGDKGKMSQDIGTGIAMACSALYDGFANIAVS
jgi:hypothetical protein